MKLVEQLKENGQDFEFYPTTNEIIAALLSDVRSVKWRGRGRSGENGSVLDIGAGNGKVLDAFRLKGGFSEFYAIEKSILLCGRLDPSIFLVGTDFHEQSLVSKAVDVTYSNPPYSEYEEWATKIIRESASRFVYLLIPVRWRQSKAISEALSYREAEHKIVGSFDFEASEDRSARAIVDLIRIELSLETDDAFDRFFSQQFGELTAKFEAPKEKGAPDDSSRFSSLTVGANYPERLVEMYNREIDNIRVNYERVSLLDVALMKELDITPARILGGLKLRLAGLRNTYWKELFTHMGQVTDRLTHKKRNHLLTTLNKSGHVDFTLTNVHAIVIWVLNNANNYIDTQLIETFEAMVEKANVRNYKSNERVFTCDRWRYADAEKPTHIALEYRIVLERGGGIYLRYDKQQVISETGARFLGDLLTVARNLGFLCETTDRRVKDGLLDVWQAGRAENFECTVAGKTMPLFEARAFLNGNMHLRLSQQFALSLNVEYGRLKGWLRNGAEASSELGDQAAAGYFGTQVQLGTGTLPVLLGGG
jgi:hypothetical protein